MSEDTPRPDRPIVWPVERIHSDPPQDTARPGIALCLSGGGYRAMLFHVGSLWRLNDCGYLPRLDRVSSVSGGSITAGVLGLNWSKLNIDDRGVSRSFADAVVAPIRRLAHQTIDVEATVRGLLRLGRQTVGAYRKYLFGRRTLRDLPERPIFVINATNVQSGVLWRFTRRFAEDYRVGTIEARTFELAEAVAASSAFPPFLSPVVLRTNPADFKPGSGLDLQRRPFTSRTVLMDGGVYDNLGLETAWKKLETVLVSDGGGKMREQPESKPDWYSQLRRAHDMTDNQVRALRKQQLIDSYVAGLRTGAYWGINTNIAHYQLDDVLDCPVERTTALARLSTRLAALDDRMQEQLINWGYAVCDAAIRRHFDRSQPAPRGFPYPGAPV